MRYIVDLVYFLMGIAYCPMILYKAWRFGRYRRGWGHRFGRVSRSQQQKPCIWLHAVSVGETNAAQGLVRQLQMQFPTHEMMISSTTDTGYARARQLFGDTCEVFYFPLDLSWVMSRVFRCLRPSLCLLMELEVWPNLMVIASRYNVPVIVVNGRMSDRSFKVYRRFRLLLKPTFARVFRALVQTSEYGERFVTLGCPVERVMVTGSLKYDTALVTDRIAGAEEMALQLHLTGTSPILVAGGTGDGEESLILEAYRMLHSISAGMGLRLVLVPRKPERFDQVAKLIEQAGFPLQRYAPVKEGLCQATTNKQAVILGDTMGDLRKFYCLAAVAFVGRSLVPMGGSDMMEVVALGKPTLFGPFTHNFRQTVKALLQGQGALEVQDVNSLVDAVQRCLSNPEFAAQLAANGREVIRANQGATERTLAQIKNVLAEHAPISSWPGSE